MNPKLPQSISTNGLKTHGGNNKYWRLLSKEILSKAFDPKRDSAAESSDLTPMPREIASPKVKKILRTQHDFKQSELIKILDQDWQAKNKEI